MRHRFEAEAEVISREIGGLEGARQKMGLSQRAVSQLLMVDPSAWTRWTQGITAVPPHILRMLEWYLLIREKHPALASQFYEKSAQTATAEFAQLKNEVKILTSKVAQVQNEKEKIQKVMETERQALRMKFFVAGIGFSAIIAAAGVWLGRH